MHGRLERVLGALERAGVRYLVVGGVAVVLHGYLRTTADLDLVVGLEPENVRRAVGAFRDLGFEPRVPVAVRVLALDDLVEMKRAVGRPQDLSDADALLTLRASRGGADG